MRRKLYALTCDQRAFPASCRVPKLLVGWVTLLTCKLMGAQGLDQSLTTKVVDQGAQFAVSDEHNLPVSFLQGGLILPARFTSHQVFAYMMPRFGDLTDVVTVSSQSCGPACLHKTAEFLDSVLL